MNKSFLKFVTLSAFAFVLGTTVVGAAFDQEDWKYYRSIPGQSAPGMVKISMPRDISWTNDNFTDLRVIDDKGIETPYVLTQNIRPEVKMVAANIVNSVTASDGSTKFVIDTNKSGVVRTSFDLEISNPDFRRQIKLYSSDTLLSLDDSRWSLVTKDGYIFSFTDPETTNRQGKSTITFSPNTARYWKAIISGGPEGPVVVTSVRSYGEVDVALPSYNEELPVSIFNNPARKVTEIVVDLGKDNLFSNSIALNSKDTNYNRKVIVEATNGTSTAGAWQYVGQGSISSIRTSLYSGVSNVVNYPTVRARFVKLSIVNGDNPVIAIDPTVTVSGPRFEFVFEAKNERSYKMFYGNPNAYRPNYDISTFASYIETAKMPSVNVGEEMVNSSYIPPKGPVVPFTESNKWLLNILLVVVVLAIGFGVVIYLKKYTSVTSKEANQMPESQPQKIEEKWQGQEEQNNS